MDIVEIIYLEYLKKGLEYFKLVEFFQRDERFRNLINKLWKEDKLVIEENHNIIVRLKE